MKQTLFAKRAVPPLAVAHVRRVALALPETIALALALGTSAGAFAQDITISAADARVSAPGPATAYTGQAITEMLFLNGEQGSLTGADITFAPGARTAWHNHPNGQYLIITAGTGWVQSRGEAKRVVRAGDVVWTPPGVFHWHGATDTRSLSHIAVWNFQDGSGGELQEQVSDADYLSAAAPE
jgi:quercetin dioxygenase-like cupin family protein